MTSEFLQSDTGVEQNKLNLTNVSEKTRLQLHEFINTRGPEVTGPHELYTYLPGYDISVTEYYDSGCMGGSTGSRRITLDDTPLPVRAVQRERRIPGVTLYIDHPVHGANRVFVPEESLDHTRFFEKESEHDHNFDTSIKQRLAASAFVSLSNDNLSPRDDGVVAVRAVEPFQFPLTSTRSSDHYKPRPFAGSFKHIDTFQDDHGRVMACITVSTYSSGEKDTTDWLPLEQLEFYAQPLSKERARTVALARTAQKLIEGNGDIARFNSLLTGDLDVAYPLPRNRRREIYSDNPSLPQYVLGRLATDNTITSLFAPAFRLSHDFHDPHLRANSLVPYDNSYWVVDHTSNLATPLLSAVFQVGDNIRGKTVEEYITV